MTTVKDGHYWIKLKYLEEPTIAKVANDGYMRVIGRRSIYGLEDLYELGPKIELPDSWKETEVKL